MNPHHFDADPVADLDSTYYPDADPNSDFLFDADPVAEPVLTFQLGTDSDPLKKVLK